MSSSLKILIHHLSYRIIDTSTPDWRAGHYEQTLPALGRAQNHT